MDWVAEISRVCGARGMSVRRLASAVGVSQTYMQEVANGKAAPSPLLKIKLAREFGWRKTPELLFELLPADAKSAWEEWVG